MTRLTRAQRRGMTTALNNAYTKAEKAGDQAQMDRIYKQLDDHVTSGSTVDRVVEGAREWRGSYRVSRGKTRFTDDLR